MNNELDPIVEAFLLPHFPAGTQVLAASTYRPDYLSYPMRVELRTPSEGIQCCVVKVDHHDVIAREFQALTILTKLNLPIPEVLFPPVPLPSEERSLLVLSELSGRPLPWCGITSLTEADLTCRLVLEAVDRLHQLTDTLLAMDAASVFARRTLADEYAMILATAGEWKRVSLFQRAVETVGAMLPDIESPLVFSNGDYNPLNFLYDGQVLCGFVDLEGACFENPHIGFARFLIWSTDEYGWGTGKKVGLVERYLYARDISRREFAPLLMLRCLSHLIRDVSVADDKDARERGHLLQILDEGLQAIKVLSR